MQLQVQRFLQSVPANVASYCALIICLRVHAQFVFVVFACCTRVQLQVQRFLQSMPANVASYCALITCLRVHTCTICVGMRADVAVATVTVASPENSPGSYPEFPLTLAQPDPDPASQSEEEPVRCPHKSSPT